MPPAAQEATPTAAPTRTVPTSTSVSSDWLTSEKACRVQTGPRATQFTSRPSFDLQVMLDLMPEPVCAFAWQEISYQVEEKNKVSFTRQFASRRDSQEAHVLDIRINKDIRERGRVVSV